MFYRPNFCCHCGEKIVRSRWTPLTSRRFCDFCEIDQKQHDLLPRVGATVALLIGAAGLTAYFGSDGRVTRDQPQVSSRATQVDTDRESRRASIANRPAATDVPNAGIAGSVNFNNALPKQLQMRPSSSIEPVYYCGSITKKGSPCTRRVKTKGPCWQHKGKSEHD